MVMLIFICSSAVVFVLGYLLGRRNDRIDIHRAPATIPPPFEAAIERIVEPEPQKTTRVRRKKRKARK